MSNSTVGLDGFPRHYASLRTGRCAEPSLAKVSETKGSAVTTSSLYASCVNVTKGILGSGVFALPVVLRDCAALPTIVLITSFAGIGAFSFVLIGYICAATRVFSYHGIWSATVGSSTAWIVQSFIVLENGFTLWTYATLVADFLCKALFGMFPGAAFLQNRILVMGIVGASIFAPLSYPRSIDALKYTSALGLMALGYSIMYVCSDWIASDLGTVHFSANLFQTRMAVFKSTALFAFSFICHYAAPQVYSELEDRSVKRFSVVGMGAFTGALCVYLAFMIAGFGRFGLEVEGNVLKNFDEGRTEVLFMWVAMALSLMFSYPLTFVTFKENVFGLWGVQEEDVSSGKRAAIVVAGVTSSVILGSIFEDASFVMGICGAVASSAIQFCFPALMYLYLPPSARAEGYGTSGVLKACSYGLIAVGMVVAVIGTGATVADAF